MALCVLHCEAIGSVLTKGLWDEEDVMIKLSELADRPEFYHLLSNSCTINIVRYANAAGRTGRFDIRHLFNGLVDSYLYHSGRVVTTLPFEELRRRSLINEVAQAADNAPDFSERIRASLPTITR